MKTFHILAVLHTGCDRAIRYQKQRKIQKLMEEKEQEESAAAQATLTMAAVVRASNQIPGAAKTGSRAVNKRHTIPSNFNFKVYSFIIFLTLFR